MPLTHYSMPVLRFRFSHSPPQYTETKTIFGAYGSSDYGCSGTRPNGYPVWLETSEWIGKDFIGNGGGGELALFVLDYYLYTLDAAALTAYLPLATSMIDFVGESCAQYKRSTCDDRFHG